VVQHEAGEGATEPVPLVILTHTAETGRFRAALRKTAALPAVAAAPVSYAMGD
jgi:hypothetical protein